MDQVDLVIRRGVAAKELLSSEAFMAATNELVNNYLAQLVNTKGEEKATRESLYSHVRAVQDIVGTLNQWIAVAEQAQMNREADEE